MPGTPRGLSSYSFPNERIVAYRRSVTDEYTIFRVREDGILDELGEVSLAEPDEGRLFGRKSNHEVLQKAQQLILRAIEKRVREGRQRI